MYGSSGRKAYTLSVLKILKSANMTSSVSTYNKQKVLDSTNKANISPIPNKLNLNPVKSKTYIRY